MALLIENVSNGKVIGVGPETVLPGEIKQVPVGFEENPVLKSYEKNGIAKLTVLPDKGDNSASAPAAKKDPDAEDAAEAIRKARLASLKTLDDEGLAKLAAEVGVNPADCKDAADMRKKVREALKA